MYQHYFKRLYHNAYRRIKSNTQDDMASITLLFTVDGKSFKVAEDKALYEIQTLRKMAEYHKPDSIMAEILVGGKKTVYRGSFDNEKETFGNKRKIKGNIKQSIDNKMETLSKDQKQVQNPSLGYIGLGEVSVDEYINKKLEEDRKDRKMADLELELTQKKEEITRLNQAINKLENAIDDSEREVDELQENLEAKKKIRYWAGLTGDILESIGVKKETLREPFAGLLASDDDQKQIPENSTEQNVVQDQSGIVEDNPQNDKRNELISLIHDYLKQVDNTTLSNIYLIFSEIEQDKSLSQFIIDQLDNKSDNKKDIEDASI